MSRLPFVFWQFSWIEALIAIATALVTSTAAVILGLRMRRRVNRALGKGVTSEAELTSLNTWMKRGGKLS
jgi:hypothetical protein